MFRKILRKTGFPFLLASYAALLWTWPEHGSLLLLLWAAAGFAFERWFPFHGEWNSGSTEARADAAYTLGTIALSTVLRIGLTLAAASATTAATDGRFWSGELPLAARVALALLISGFFPYWLHRIAHEHDGFLWRAHAVHHAPRGVYSLNALRIHPLNTAWNTVFGLIPLLALGADRDTLLIAGGLDNFFSLFNHFNIDFHNPLLARILNTAELHRWHHSSKREEGDTNYSSGALAVWDVVFGSWFLPERRMAASSAGLYDEASFPASFRRQLLHPFCNCT